MRHFIDTLHHKFNLYFEGEAAGAGSGTGNKDVNTVVNAAVDAVNKDIKPEDKKEPEKKATDDKEDKKDDNKTEDDLTAEQLGYAKTLFKALSNPNPKIQKRALEAVAKGAGFDLKEVETKEEIKEVKKDVLALLKKALPEYEDLTDRLGPALKEIIEGIVEERTKDIREEATKDRNEREANRVDEGIEKAFGKWDNAVKVKAEVLKLMDEFPRRANKSYEEYFTGLIRMAASEKGISLEAKGDDKSKELKDKETKDKQDKNRNDAQKRLASDRTSEAKEGVRSSNRKTLDTVVREAAEESFKRMNA